jgi:uncharacterized protein YqjF (DUF2071 family)
MEWVDLLFIHWPIEITALRPFIPPGLAVDTFDGQAWIGVVPFGMRGVRPRLAPAVPWLSSFLELNVRTYVTAGEKPGVWFFSLDAANPVAVQLARTFFHLPYFNARIALAQRDGWISYSSQRTHRGAAGAEFQGRYRPTGEPYHAPPGSLDEWLTARYCLYASSGNTVLRGEIHHPPWPLQPAVLELDRNTTLNPHFTQTFKDQKPVLHYARHLPVVAWALEHVAQNEV